MRRTRVWLLAGGILVLTGALAVSLIVARGSGGAEGAGSSPLAIVLVPELEGSRLVAVDADSGKLVATTRLRSLATDIEADEERGTVVAAQTGGVAGAADDVLAIVDPRSGEVGYVRLPQIDPSQVECIAGRALVLHAVIDQAGFVVSAVDLATRAATDAGRVPDGTGLWAAASGRLWTAVPTRGAVPFVLSRIDPHGLAVTQGPDLGFTPYGIVQCADSALVLGGMDEGESARGRVALLDGTTAAVTTTGSVQGLPHGARIAAVVGTSVVVGDWCGELPETASLEVLDRATLLRTRTLKVGGAPCALAAYDGSVLVVDRIAGDLVRIDPDTGTVRWRTPLGARDLVCSKIVVLPGTSRGAPAPKADEIRRTAGR